MHKPIKLLIFGHCPGKGLEKGIQRYVNYNQSSSYRRQAKKQYRHFVLTISHPTLEVIASWYVPGS
jgi:hypothetical protein